MAGRHFLQIPGPSAVPERILNAINQQVIDHRGPDFGPLGLKCLSGMNRIFQTEGDVVIYPASGTGAWEAALVNTCSPGDKVLMFETGHFAFLWHKLATRIGLAPEVIESDWRAGANPEAIHDRLKADTGHEIHAVCVVHNETSTGCTSRIADVRKAVYRRMIALPIPFYENNRVGELISRLTGDVEKLYNVISVVIAESDSRLVGGKRIAETVCLPCHGLDGQGAGRRTV